MEEFKPNSYKSREDSEPIEESKRAKQIITGDVKTKKNNWFNKFTELLGTAVSYAWKDILIPAAQKASSEMVNNIADILIYGEAKPKTTSSVPAQRVSYRSYYEQAQKPTTYSRRPEDSYAFEEVILNSRADAEAVLNELDAIAKKYGFARVADLYDLVGLRTNYTDNNYGWTDMRSAQVVRYKDGYLISMPKPMAID